MDYCGALLFTLVPAVIVAAAIMSAAGTIADAIRGKPEHKLRKTDDRLPPGVVGVDEGGSRGGLIGPDESDMADD